MIGQGSPKTSEGRPASTAPSAAVRWWWPFALLLWALTWRGLAAEEMIRVRIAWGGGAERIWRGTISLSAGTISRPSPLGIEADEPGSMWLQADPITGGDRLVIREQSPRAYDGVDLSLNGPSDARLLMELTALDDPEHPTRIEVPLETLSGGVHNENLDDRGNRLLAHRAPGDRLQIDLQRDNLVFAAGEKFPFTVKPHALPLKPGEKVKLKVSLVETRGGRELWTSRHDVQAGRPVAISEELNLPSQEGVYELVIVARHIAGWAQAVRRPLKWKETVAQRKVQLLVLESDGRGRVPSIKTEELSCVVEINPANPRWWELLTKLPQLPKIPRLWKRPLGNGNMQVLKHPLGELVRLGPSSKSPDVSWEAYTLPIKQPGRPHVLEVDYPSDVPQTLGISILEPNAAGAIMPIGLDSGFDQEKQPGGREPGWRRHRLIFWPRSTSPMVLMTNRRSNSPAAFGKIRVLAGWKRLPGMQLPEGSENRRLLAAYLDRPLFPENFSAAESLDVWSGYSLDDWVTFYEGGTRLVEYLRHVGYNALAISVLADGSTIYPSEVLQPTPRFDKGVLFNTGQDPVRKDVLEMLFRLFDRQQLQLIPALEFSAPLPELEAIVRDGGPESEAIQWINSQGLAWRQVHRPRRGLAPYYNVLHPRVQEAMLTVVRELITRYAHHRSLGGLALQLSAHGYAQLPAPQWGMDDATIARFQGDTGLKVPGSGAKRFAQRAEFLAGPRHRPLWLQWRAEALGRFHRRLQAEVHSLRPEARLYLCGANMLAGEDFAAQLRPTLTQRTTIADALLEAGIDARHYQTARDPVLLRPSRFAPSGALAASAMNMEIDQMPDVDRYFRGLPTTGSVFFHEPQEVRVESFDRKSPFKPTYTWLFSQPVPSGQQNRRRFVHGLAALDAQLIVDGGWLLPMGQEESIRDLVAAYRRLPAARFKSVADGWQADASQPVTFRYATHRGRTIVYAVNDSPFEIAAGVRVDAPDGCRLEELTGLREIRPLRRDSGGPYWTIALRPYDLVAAEFSRPGVQLSRPWVSLPAEVQAALESRIRKLGARVASLRNPPPLGALENPGFERPPRAADRVPGWASTRRPGITIEPDKVHTHGGNQSVRMSSNGPIGCLVSRPLAAGCTGRLSVSVWLRVADARAQPPLRLALEGKLAGRDYYRFAPVGLAPDGAQAAVPITTNWAPYVFQVNDLPLEGLSQLRVRFDLMGAGEVWLDDVQLFDLAFSENEHTELLKLIALARVTLHNGQVGDCVRLLDGYWPRFLEEKVAVQPGTTGAGILANKPGKSPPPAPRPPDNPPHTGLLDRMKGLLPEQLR